MAYYIIDVLWGIFYNLKIVPIVYAATVLYFFIMAMSVFLWTHYVITYIEENTVFRMVMKYAGWLFIIFETSILIINLFKPIAFWFEADGTYHTNSARFINLMIQIVMFAITSIYMFLVAARSTGRKKHRHRAIGFFSLAMTISILGQERHPFLPLYSVGCMIGTCLLHTFVLEDEKEERHKEIQELQKKEIEQERELSSAIRMAYTDSLTGVKNKHSYLETESLAEQNIAEGTLKEFGIVVFDLNGLKEINDTKGHDSGDQYIKAACSLICSQFKHSPVFRIGGDEFVAILEGEDYKNHQRLIDEFEFLIEKNQHENKVVISEGYAQFIPENKESFIDVFERADKKMYERKRTLKELAKSLYYN